MVLVQNWLPPSRENWELICWGFQLFPLFALGQFVTPFYPMGKTSIESRLNIPGKWAWFTMEIPGAMVLLYTVFTLPKELGLDSLPWGNWVMVGMFCLHYLYRAILSPLLLNPSMSPIHPAVWLSALAFQLANGLSLGGWLAGHGPTDPAYWSARRPALQAGSLIWAAGLLANWYHDDVLREIRRAAAAAKSSSPSSASQSSSSSSKAAAGAGAGAGGAPEGKVYLLPGNGLFRYVLFAHYLCEWVEWGGFWLVGGPRCVPARTFLANEVASMLPRAWNGWHWYVERFGRDRVGDRKAVIPWLI